LSRNTVYPKTVTMFGRMHLVRGHLVRGMVDYPGNDDTPASQ